MNSYQSEKTDFEKVYDSYSDLLYRLALSYVRTPENAEDIVQDVFEKYMEGGYSFQNEEHRRAWLIRVAIHRCRDLLRKNRIRTHLSLEEAAGLPQPEDSALPRAFQLLELLPEKYRAVMALHYLEGYGVKEVSSMLNLSASAVKMRLSRGREMLKDHLKEEL